MFNLSPKCTRGSLSVARFGNYIALSSRDNCTRAKKRSPRCSFLVCGIRNCVWRMEKGEEDICRWNIDGCIILRAISERDKMEMGRIEGGISREKEKEGCMNITIFTSPLAFFGVEHRGDARMNIPPAHFLISSILFVEICPYTAHHIANVDRKILSRGCRQQSISRA